MGEENKVVISEQPLSWRKYRITLKQEKFCRLYTSNDTELFGNGTQCYARAFNADTTKPGWQKNVAIHAARLLRNERVLARIRDLLDEGGFNEINADKQLLFLMNQHVDFHSKLGAIKEFNALKGRVTKKQITLVKNFNQLLDEIENEQNQEQRMEDAEALLDNGQEEEESEISEK